MMKNIGVVEFLGNLEISQKKEFTRIWDLFTFGILFASIGSSGIVM